MKPAKAEQPAKEIEEQSKDQSGVKTKATEAGLRERRDD